MTVRLKLTSSGPMEVHGLEEVVQIDGTVHDVRDRPRVLLCGCGRSSNPPFCTGSHNALPAQQGTKSSR